MSSDGYATGAVRDLIDLLDSDGEDVTIFCVHDADAYGTGIHEALQNETATRPGRKFTVVNLGLDPAEAIAMAAAGLVEVERLKAKDGRTRRKPVAKYVTDPEMRDWLQENRVELNAMSTPQFLSWLDGKLAPYAGKVVPPADVLADRLSDNVEEEVRRIVTERVLAEAGVDALVARAVAELGGAIADAAGTLAGVVTGALRDRPQDPWSASVTRVARTIARAEP
jgi:hypothetical protein